MGLALKSPKHSQLIRQVNTLRLSQQMDEPEMAAVLQAIENYEYEHDHLPPNKQAVFDSLKEVVPDFPKLDMDKTRKKKTTRWIIDLFEENDYSREKLLGGNNEHHSNELSELFLTEYYFLPRVSEVAHSDVDMEELKERLFEIHSDVAGARMDSEPDIVCPLKEPWTKINELETEEIGVEPLSRLMPEGWRPSELVVLLGPTGGGKSMAAIECAVKAAEKGPVYHATYEQSALKKAQPSMGEESPLFSEFTIRGVGAHSGIRRSDLGDGGGGSIDNLNERQMDILRDMSKSDAAENWRVYDYTGQPPGSSNLSAFASHLERMSDTLGRHSLVIVDPLWPMVLKTAASKGMTTSEPSQLRGEAQDMVERLHNLAEDLEVTLLLIHQLGASAAKKSKNIDVYSAAEIRTIGFRVETLIAISKMDKYNQCHFILAKGRNTGAQGTAVKAKVDGDLNQFRVCSEDEEFLEDSGAEFNVTDAESAHEVAHLTMESPGDEDD